MKWNTFHMQNIGAASDPEFFRKGHAAYEYFKQLRSEIIDASLSVEAHLTSVLVAFFAGAESDRAELLKVLLLDAEFCTFFQKWKLLRELLEIYEVPLKLQPAEMKALRKDLHEIITLRNRFAHGTLEVDASDFSVSMEYFEGTKKRSKLDKEQLAASHEMFNRVCLALIALEGVLRSKAYALPPTDA